MSKPGPKDGSLLVTLSSFWRRLFKDEGHLEGIYKAAEILFGQIYREMLENARATALETTPVFGKDYWREIFLVEAEQDIRVTTSGTEYAFPLDEDIVSFRYLQDRVTTPTRVFEVGIDFRLEFVDEAPWVVFFSGNPLETDEVAVSFIVRDVETVLTGKDAAVDYGTPNEHLPSTEPDRTTAKNARYLLRRTLTIDGIRYETRNATFFDARDTWIQVPDGIFTPAIAIGKTLRGYHVSGGVLVAEDRTITGVAQSDVLVIDAPYDSAFNNQVQFIDTETFQLEHVGFSLVVDDQRNPVNSGTYIIESVTSGTEVVLKTAFPFDDTTPRLMTSVTRAALVLSIPTAQTRFTYADIGRVVYVSDASGNEGFFEIESLATPNASGFFQDVTVKDPDSELTAFDTTGLNVSVRVQDPSASRVAWELQTPEITRRAQLFGPDLEVDRRYLSERYGVLVDREEQSSEAYKAFLRGVYQYFWVGPTRFAIESALNTMVGFPVIEREGELLLRVVQSADKDELFTDRRSYILPAGYVKEELLEKTAERTKVFRQLESISNAFIVEDLVSDPTWLFNLVLPSSVMPDDTETRRLVNPRLRRTAADGLWQVGDPGVFIGTAADGVVREDDVIEIIDAFVSGTTVTTDSTKIIGTYLSKTVMISGRRRQITSVPTDQSFTIDSALDAPLIAHFNPSADLDGDSITIATYEFTGVKDVGRPIVTSGGTFYVDSVVGTHEALLVDSTGTPMSAAPGTEVVNLGYTMNIINRAPMHAPVGLVVAETLAGPNMFGIRYELDAETLPLATLQDDIQDIIYAGRPAHTIFLNFPFQVLSDLIYVDDTLRTAAYIDGAGVAGDFTLLSRPLRVDGSWKVGEIFFLNHGYITWEKRISFAEMASLPPSVLDGSSNILHEVFDGRSATELLLDLEADNTGELYTIEVHFWNGSTFNYLATVNFDTSSPQIEILATGGLYYAFVVTSSTGTDVVLRVGARRDSVVERVNIANHPNGTGSISVGVDTLTDASFDFFESDVGRELFLAYDVSGTMVYEQVRIIARTSINVVQLVYKTTNLAFSPSVSSTAVSWQFGAQKRWGQTALFAGGQDPSLDPPLGAPTGSGYGVELPLQVAIID